MEEIYSRSYKKNMNQLPSKKTKDFILNYSKALKVFTCGGLKVEVLIN
jgi:hypothetical protein